MKKKTIRTKTKVAAPARLKKRVPNKSPKARWHQEAVIHQDVFFAEASAEP